MLSSFSEQEVDIILDAYASSCQKITKATKDETLLAVKSKILNLTKFLDEYGYNPIPMKVRIAHIVNSISAPFKCVVCGNNALFSAMTKAIPDKVYKDVCSEKCSKSRGTSRKYDNKYETFLKDSKDWLFEEHVTKRQSLQAMAKKYGVSEPTLKRWLIYWDIEHIDYRLVGSESNRYLNDEKWLREKYIEEGLSAEQIGKILGCDKTTVCRYLQKFSIPITPANSYPRKFVRVSKPELEIISFIKSLRPDLAVESSNRSTLNGKEIDILVPSLGLGFEYDGFPHHTEIFGGKTRHYHKDKTDGCELKDIKLLHITSAEWMSPTKKEIWKSMISSMIGANEKLFARKCSIDADVSQAEAETFLVENHLQGSRRGDKTRIGLRLNGDLVALMCFSRSPYDAYEWELTRFCSKRFITVVGAASKLLKKFRDDESGVIVSYADRRYSDGGLYKTLGFEETARSGPRYHYVKDNKMFNRQMFMRNKLPRVLDQIDPTLTERANVLANGYDIYWDCGTITFVLK